MNIDIKNILDNFYSYDLDLFPERGVLEALYSREIWDKLSDNEKVSKSRSRLESYKVHSLKSNKVIEYEETVIKIAELILFFYNETESRYKDLKEIGGVHLYLFRIRNLLYCELKVINRNISLRVINHVLLEIIEPLINNVSESNEYKEYRLDEFVFEYKKMFQLLEQKPYSK